MAKQPYLYSHAAAVQVAKPTVQFSNNPTLSQASANGSGQTTSARSSSADSTSNFSSGPDSAITTSSSSALNPLADAFAPRLPASSFKKLFDHAAKKQFQHAAKNKSQHTAKDQSQPATKKQPQHGAKKQEKLPAVIYEVREAPGKGEGLFAKCDIPAGTCIIKEEAVLKIPRNDICLVWEPYCKLGRPQKEVFDNLCSFDNGDGSFEQQSRLRLLNDTHTSLEDEEVDGIVAEHVRVMAIFGTNNFITANGEHAVFATASRINHSCVPNVHVSHNPNANPQSKDKDKRAKETVYASRDIAAGEELLTDYLGDAANFQTAEVRSQATLGRYGFVCQCTACVNSAGTDLYRVHLGGLCWGLEQHINGVEDANHDYIPRSNETALKTARYAITLFEQLGLRTTSLGKMFRVASIIALCSENYRAAMEFAVKGLKLETTLLGANVEDLKKNGAAAETHVLEVGQAMMDAGARSDSVELPAGMRKKLKKMRETAARIDAAARDEWAIRAREYEEKMEAEKGTEADKKEATAVW